MKRKGKEKESMGVKELTTRPPSKVLSLALIVDISFPAEFFVFFCFSSRSKDKALDFLEAIASRYRTKQGILPAILDNCIHEQILSPVL